MPRQPTTELERKRAALAGARRWVRRVRLTLAAVLVLLTLYVALSYRINTLPGAAQAQPAFHDLGWGDTVLMLNINLWRAPKLNDIVLYENPAGSEREMLIGRIAGLPGEGVKRVGPTMAVGDREPLTVGFDIGPDVPIRDGDVIPHGHYLILIDTDAANYVDSREVGYVPTSLIRRKVVMNLSPLFGQPDPA